LAAVKQVNPLLILLLADCDTGSWSAGWQVRFLRKGNSTIAD
jgi:hypothetical protein